MDRPETITFGIDSGAVVTVITPETVSDYPKVQGSAKKKMRDCQGNAVADLGSKHLALDTGAAKACFAKVTVANVKKNLSAVSDLVKMGHQAGRCVHEALQDG